MTDQPTDLDRAIVDHLTRAQRHWLAVGEQGVNDREEMRYHITGHAYEVTTVFLIAALKRLAPAYADSLYLELRHLLETAPNSGSWTWMELASRGIDPGSIVAFKPLKAAAEPVTATVRPADGTQAELGLADSLPAQTGTAHNALDDARWTRDAWAYLHPDKAA